MDVIKIGKAIISLKVFNGYIYSGKKKHIPQHFLFRCGVTHLNYSLEKLRKTFKLPKELLKTELNHDGIDENNWKDKKGEWFFMSKTTSCARLIVMRDFVKLCKKLRDFQ